MIPNFSNVLGWDKVLLFMYPISQLWVRINAAIGQSPPAMTNGPKAAHREAKLVVGTAIFFQLLEFPPV